MAPPRSSLNKVAQLIAGSPPQGPTRTEPLARLVHEKTAGNPFFAIQFLTALAEERLLEFDPREGAWRWDVNRIRARRITENVVDLLVGKLTRLPDSTRETLKQIAALGNSAETTALTMVRGRPENKLHADLRAALYTGIA